ALRQAFPPLPARVVGPRGLLQYALSRTAHSCPYRADARTESLFRRSVCCQRNHVASAPGKGPRPSPRTELEGRGKGAHTEKHETPFMANTKLRPGSPAAQRPPQLPPSSHKAHSSP